MLHCTTCPVSRQEAEIFCWTNGLPCDTIPLDEFNTISSKREVCRRAKQRGWTEARNTNQGGQKARVFVFRVGGKPRVAQPPEHDRPKCAGVRSSADGPKRGIQTKEGRRPECLCSESEGSRALRSRRNMTGRSVQACGAAHSRSFGGPPQVPPFSKQKMEVFLCPNLPPAT